MGHHFHSLSSHPTYVPTHSRTSIFSPIHTTYSLPHRVITVTRWSHMQQQYRLHCSHQHLSAFSAVSNLWRHSSRCRVYACVYCCRQWAHVVLVPVRHTYVVLVPVRHRYVHGVANLLKMCYESPEATRH